MRPPSCWLTSTVSVGAHRAGPSVRLCASSASLNWEDYHVPVLRDETVRWLVSEPSGIYADCTLGGGGHSEAILRLIGPSGGRIVCADRDADALRQADRRLRPFVESGAATLLQTNFGSFPQALERLAPSLRGDGRAETDGLLSGLLLDLGVSSHQIDDAQRGFSFRFDGPLDMRMDQSSGESALTAATIVNEWEPHDIADVLWRHGEERASRLLARAIVAARPLTTTAQLSQVVASTWSNRTPLKCTFGLQYRD
jgi:16S rRNA (cytosine1402-N4)-methyltransferase